MDKTPWGPGPWKDEPDLVEWWSRGVPCLAVRGPMGSWCGYVAVRRGHPWYLRDYDSVGLECHGGLTFSGVRLRGDGWWWLGWDYSHYGDYSPALAAIVADLMPEPPALLPGRRETYWPLALVEREVEAAARVVARLPVRVMSRRREAKALARVRVEARRTLVRVAGSPGAGWWWVRDVDWRAMAARSALRRLGQYPVRGVSVPRSLRACVEAK